MIEPSMNYGTTTDRRHRAGPSQRCRSGTRLLPDLDAGQRARTVDRAARGRGSASTVVVDYQSIRAELNEPHLFQRADDRIEVLIEQCQQVVVPDVPGGDDEQPTRERRR